MQTVIHLLPTEKREKKKQNKKNTARVYQSWRCAQSAWKAKSRTKKAILQKERNKKRKQASYTFKRCVCERERHEKLENNQNETKVKQDYELPKRALFADDF